MNNHAADQQEIQDPLVDRPGSQHAARPAVADVAPGGSFDLRIHHVTKRIGDGTHRMLSYNGSIPGPILRVQQDSEIEVHVTNETDMDTTIHWHGLRLENRYDGVPHETQAPIPPGGRYTHRLRFPDAGLFWYHPHMREDYAQEMGLYGNVIVEPTDPSYWPFRDREVLYTLDDILIEDDEIVPFDPRRSNFTAMGRFGNVLLIDGETHQELEVRGGDVVRFGFTNSANTRVFKLMLPGLRMKLVGADGGRYEREQWADDVVVAPSERAIVDVLFDRSGQFELQHVTPERAYDLATITVTEVPDERHSAAFDTLRVHSDMAAERERAAGYLEAPPDKTLALVAEMAFEEADTVEDRPYVCPMHPEVLSDEPGKCPKCGMKLMPAAQVAAAVGEHAEHRAHHGTEGHQEHADALADGIEWEDLMPEVNRRTTPANMRWKLIDRDTGKANMDIDWIFNVGDQVKIRLVNEMESDHPMHHPFHVHGERFLVLARNGIPEENLVWKDTVLIPAAAVIDILMDASNPGVWMAHCHIAEHMEAGMAFDFKVASEPQSEETSTSSAVTERRLTGKE